jgi:hypothetical protein
MLVTEPGETLTVVANWPVEIHSDFVAMTSCRIAFK